MAERKLPVGIQSFEKLITEGFIYVDKTDHIYRLVHNNVPYFLCRPRRFGKSLLLSTIKAYWEGKKELFSGLKISDMEKENPDPWREYQVFYFDFNGADYRTGDALEGTIDFHLRNWENKYGTFREGDNLAERFQLLLKKAYEVTGLRSVILVDEYDKPLLDTLDDPELKEHNRAVFKSFFSVLKGLDEYIQFSLITGVTKFEKVSIFSDLNNLEDISADSDYANVCGLTEDEITTNFGIELDTLAEQYGVGAQECLMRLKRMYDGYCFSSDTHLKVYNPYSVLTALKKRKFGAYWFETGTPSFLVKKLKDSCFDVKRLTDKTIYANERLLADYRADSADFVPLLYQTGYLTIIDYDKTGEFYTLGLPNEEVEYALMESLMPEYVSDYGAGTGKDILTLRRYVESGDTDGIKKVLTALFAGIPYTNTDAPFEHYFQTVIYIVFTLLNQFVECEVHTFSGRIDCKVETDRFIYLFEFKRDDTAEAALKQIDDKDYALPFTADSRKVYKIGVSFDSETRKLNGWIAKE